MTSQLPDSFDPSLAAEIGIDTNSTTSLSRGVTTGASPTNLPRAAGGVIGETPTDKIKLSAADAVVKLFKDPQNMNSKTPISLLQELCSKSLLAPPIYELVSAEGLTHAPTFAYRCHLTNEYVAIGSGSSKKRAKHAAALEVLKKCRDSNIGVNDRLAGILTNLMEIIDTESKNDISIGDELSSLSIKDENNLSALSSDAATAGEQDLPTCENPKFEKIRQECIRSVNPVGELIEIAQRKAQRPPEFVFGDEQGPPHDRKFICVAKFENMEDIEGFGKSKKAAKRQAALKLLFKLKTTEGFFNNEDGKNGTAQSNDSRKVDATNGGSNGSSSGQTGSKKGVNNANMPNLYQQIRVSQKEAAKKLLSIDVDAGNQDELSNTLLEALSKEENFQFKVFYKVVQNEHFAFIQFQTNPSIVITSSGASQEIALRNAAYSSLVHLVLMCSR